MIRNHERLFFCYVSSEIPECSFQLFTSYLDLMDHSRHFYQD